MTAIAPSTIKLFELPSLPLEWYKALPKCAAIYIAYKSEQEILYVGRSTNIQNRWVSHHLYVQLQEIGNVQLAWIEVSDISMLSAVESALIEYYQPPLNFAPGSPRKALTRLRNQAGLRVIDVALELDISESTVRNWEKGRNTPRFTINQIDKLLNIYNCSFEELLNADRKSRKTKNNP